MPLSELPLMNPFGAPIYYVDETTSTMDEARRLTAAVTAPLEPSPLPEASLHGTVIVADVQRAGRGRAAGRRWVAEHGESLLFTLILRYPQAGAMPAALPLRLGVAVALSMEELWPQLAGRIRVKWPNDVLIDGKKVAGILCEGDGRQVYAGIGINVHQRSFSAELAHRSTSLALALEHEDIQKAAPYTQGNSSRVSEQDLAGNGISATGHLDRFALLINLLGHIQNLLQEPARENITGEGMEGSDRKQQNPDKAAVHWHREIQKRLYRAGERVRFLAGSTEDPRVVTGILEGVSEEGELLILETGAGQASAWITGELDV